MMCAAWQANPSKSHLFKTLLASLIVSIYAPLRAGDSGIFLGGGFQYASFTLHAPPLKKEHLYGGDVEMGWMSFLCQKKSKNSPYCTKSSPFGMRFYALLTANLVTITPCKITLQGVLSTCSLIS
ncbi:hypothetical protein [Helicobacter felis]|uniref:hypothetical protein n=1 Tax=Helicobacter felis TaxID=214 RepID=UPI000CF0947B|nr:hypothetical protein [Helicobacter felis]